MQGGSMAIVCSVLPDSVRERRQTQANAGSTDAGCSTDAGICAHVYVYVYVRVCAYARMCACADDAKLM